MNRRSFLPAALLLLAGMACEAPTAPGERDSLEAARTRWRALGSQSYTYDVNRSCFCLLGGRRMMVTVQAGQVTAAEFQDSGAGVEPALLSYVPTIADLFDMIEDALNRHASYFSAEYDPSYGYPTRIEIDYSSSATDDEVAISARDLLPLTTPVK
jgi:hypothetical protein